MVTQALKSKGQDSAIPNERMDAFQNKINQYLTYNFIYRHVLEAARRPIGLDERQVDAVAARIELDLRIGAAFTRLQTLQLQTLGGALAEKIISYGNLFIHCFFVLGMHNLLIGLLVQGHVSFQLWDSLWIGI